MKFSVTLRELFRSKWFYLLRKLVDIIGIRYAVCSIKYNIYFIRWFIRMHVIKTFILEKCTKSEKTVQTVGDYEKFSSIFIFHSFVNGMGGMDPCYLLLVTMGWYRWTMKQFINKMRMASRRQKFVASVSFVYFEAFNIRFHV